MLFCRRPAQSPDKQAASSSPIGFIQASAKCECGRQAGRQAAGRQAGRQQAGRQEAGRQAGTQTGVQRTQREDTKTK